MSERRRCARLATLGDALGVRPAGVCALVDLGSLTGALRRPRVLQHERDSLARSNTHPENAVTGLGAVGGIGGFLILYGVEHNAAVAAAVIYGAIGLIVPLVGGAIAYLFLRREFAALANAPAASVSTAA